MTLPPLTAWEPFAGIGGFALAAKQIGGFNWTSLENNPAAIAVLQSNFDHPILAQDIRTFHPEFKAYNLMVGGFPCGGTSKAGTRKGLAHSQSSLFREFLRCIEEGLPSYVVLEQPIGFEHRGLKAWVGGMTKLGYSTLDPILLSGALINIQVERLRMYIISYLNEPETLKGQPRGWGKQLEMLIENEQSKEDTLSIAWENGVLIPKFPLELQTSYKPSLSVPPKYPGRMTSRILSGKTIVVAQARIILSLVYYLYWQRLSLC
ncbi:MAG: hypothetical protein F6K63_29920 [Moorea sp. SIO1G6]|uniref:DNA cytosine methyltransferase n=1 Tax=Moorena sp. SIO1G6 TaxID=2607840 RepID=UPI0013BEDAA6|nr:DNA cytosine methyltransferase [Moorena sp. SIO1G6]NET68388.1 hypothetical protein [Moorena sp. SIO1G6]